ncbi:DegT/DnrJ/EryC1/StrS family aminotransferase [Polynucleobacter sphagniphilus]|uniref:DegT/DnrJ/EryC1/StrS family aminotransferase n=1 Tax=Polynucleobacter sphagniphilus TaxID=1743169 RepID=UPI0018E94173|nr:DegT/DnrJ/EryC1/StrS family aminotransferase [Polynucleobacter sphagniphilus]MDH6524788.1 dTDP-4-amino-4,6-dideoxygalactose transaminase [Polynucleobacter sphagniphilus]
MQNIYVTKPYLPPLDEFYPYLEKIWASGVLTNGAAFHQELEAKLCEYLGVRHLSLFSNGTIALITALQALGIKGEVITTPYSFVATAHSLLWNGITPVFVDVDPLTLNLDPAKIEAAITPNTTAIMPVHCYGYPCDVVAIEGLAKKYGLRVIYDAAHAFGVRFESGESILNYGDLSVLSFHATKVFNTFEGGAIISPDLQTKTRIDQLKNFGFTDEITVIEAGINGKMSEVNAAFGLLQLKYVNEAIELRKNIDHTYRQSLSAVSGIECIHAPYHVVGNYSYFPVLVTPQFPLSRDALYEKLKTYGVFTRRYFYPLISSFPMYKNFPSANPENLTVSTDVANKILCLPIYPDLTPEQQGVVIDAIKSCVS